ncbi:C4-dicarboxylate transporter [Fimbriiglobus ruber]|uniref:C4-dicarboxylate transporter n=1 Tax=Fimbriiglobus ruber TaxID=1908690 RepID=A0A225D8F4_9BACT|nr:C4-dicarboxylate transporter [Fimbriiglobus ruber]
MWAAVLVIGLAVAGVMRGIDVRLVLFAAALALGALAGDLAPIVRDFVDTFSNEKFVIPICSAMGFAYVLKYTECDRHLVRLLVTPLRKVRFLLVPGVVLVGFLVNIPVISQTSTAVCLGTVVVPVMRAAGFSPLAIGAALLLGASVGGELLNPGAPELGAIRDKTHVPTQSMMPAILPLVLPVLGVSALVLWVTTWLSERRLGPAKVGTIHSPGGVGGIETSTEREAVKTTAGALVTGESPKVESDSSGRVARDDTAAGLPRINLLKAIVPLVPLALLFLSGPPLYLFEISQDWVIPPPAKGATVVAKIDSRYSSRIIGLAMLIGVGAAVAVTPTGARNSMKAFFEGAGYGFTNIISLIVTAKCFGTGIEKVGFASHVGNLIAQNPGLLHPLAGTVPAAFAFICGSGMASTQSLYGFFYDPAVALEQDPVAVGAMVSVGSAVGRTMSPVAAVVLMTANLTGVRPIDLVKRVGPALVAGLVTAIVLRVLGIV